ncbi:MAG: glycoside hydrolase family 127 protein [Gemmataceae bacterium]|nr:glycoside hydrolase family 127 protein [Gemmataceae bacterium]
MTHAVELNVVTPARGRGPVTTGIPFPRGALPDAQHLRLQDASGKPVRLQSRALDSWPDGSARWVLLDWIAEAGAGPYRLEVGTSGAVEGPAVKVAENGNFVVIDTGATRFEVGAIVGLFLFGHPDVSSRPGGTRLTFWTQNEAGRRQVFAVRGMRIEEAGPLRTCVRLWGHTTAFLSWRSRAAFEVRFHFFAASGITRVEFTISNPRRAAHPGGLWDLGDAGSIYFKEVAAAFERPAGTAEVVRCSPELNAPTEEFSTPFELYQDSSGGENWKSNNHLNREHEIPVSFRGYRIKNGAHERTGLRATPLVTLSSEGQAVGVAVPQFWQNFPMAVEATPDTLTLKLLPGQFADLHELQGGEQKTWTFAVAFGPDATPETLEWFRQPVRPYASPEWYCASGAIPYLTPKSSDPNTDYLKLVDAALEGPNNFDAKREKIDEYGWRHFGDIYGDHEAVYHTGPQPMVSHYNNQYDPVAGFAYQFLRSGDLRWLRHMEELAQHVIDIDIYHTTQDKSAYNGGLFWHTYHYADADTGTHRSYPRALLQLKGMPGLDPNDPKAQKSRKVYALGGGPANEHNYTTGLMLHYFMTGNEAAREAALGLARWVIDMDDGRKTIFRWLAGGDTGRASQSRDPGYHGPGRGSGNSLSALLDGHRLSGDVAFLNKAEQLIRRCIHPLDDVPKRNLLDVENRWFYTMFLQAIGRYLDHKTERDQLDGMYAYARASLLHYARWMAAHEVPTLSRPEILEYPNETWAAQDMRKSEVFAFAAKHAAGVEKAQFLDRARFFFADSVARLTAFETRTLARPVVLLLSYGYRHAHLQQHPDESAPSPKAEVTDFGRPEAFVPQKVKAVKRAKLLMAIGGVTGLACVAGLVGWLILKFG